MSEEDVIKIDQPQELSFEKCKFCVHIYVQNKKIYSKQTNALIYKHYIFKLL